jgi:hypothetical protein
MIGENRPVRGRVPGDMTAVRRSVAVVLIALATVIAARTPGAGTPPAPAGGSTPGGNPAAPSIAPGASGY